MITEVLALVISIFLLSWSMVTHPTHGACPRGWFLDEGVQRDGSYECVQSWRNIESPQAYQPPGVLHDRIYCSGGSHPIQVQDGRTVGCQR